MGIAMDPVQPGQYKYFEVKVDGKDVTRLVLKCEIYQDIFMPTWSCTISFMDAINKQHDEDIFPGVDVFVTIETKSDLPCGGTSKKIYKFVLASISNKVLIKKSVYGYDFHCVPPEAIKDLKTRLSKYYEMKTPQDLVNSILNDTGLGKAETDQDPKKYDVIIPNWTGFTAVNWVCKFAKMPKRGADFMFFQKDNGGSFKFKSMEQMYLEKSGYYFVHESANYKNLDGTERKENFIKILSYKYDTQIDGMRNLSMGFFGNTSIAHDVINKKIIKTPYTYSEDLIEDQIKKPWKGEYFNDAEDSSIGYKTYHGGLTPKIQSIHETHDTWRGSRRSHQLKVETNRMFVHVPGAACLWNSLGKTIEIRLPPQEDISKQQLDKYLKGDHLVLGLRHVIDLNNYWVFFELSKKRLEVPIGG